MVWLSYPDEAIPWDSILVESYRVLRCLCSGAIRRIYENAAHWQVTLGVTWPANGIVDPVGLCLGTLRAVAPSEPPGWRRASQSSAVEFGVEPWPTVQSFVVHVLSRAGYKHHEKTIRGIDRDIALEFCFPHPSPLRNVMARYTL